MEIIKESGRMLEGYEMRLSSHGQLYRLCTEQEHLAKEYVGDIGVKTI